MIDGTGPMGNYLMWPKPLPDGSGMADAPGDGASGRGGGARRASPMAAATLAGLLLAGYRTIGRTARFSLCGELGLRARPRRQV